MAAPDGAVEQWTGYPTIDPQSINPFADWPIIQQAQADWLAQHSILDFASYAELTTLVSSLPSSDTTFALTRDTGYLWYWSSGEWKVFSGASAPTAPALATGYSFMAGYGTSSRVVWSGGLGVVHVQGGVIKAAGGGATLFTLPVAHRPSSNRWLGGFTASDGKSYSLVVLPSGAVQFATGYATGSVADGAGIPAAGSFPL